MTNDGRNFKLSRHSSFALAGTRGMNSPLQSQASKCSAAVSAASFGGVPPRFYGEMSPPRTGSGTVPKLAGEDARATRARASSQNAFFEIRRVTLAPKHNPLDKQPKTPLHFVLKCFCFFLRHC